MSEIKIIIEKYLHGNISVEERERLQKWILASEDNKKLFEHYIREYDRNMHLDFDVQDAFQRFSETVDKRKSGSDGSRGFFAPKRWLKYAAVLTILLALGLWIKNEVGKTTIATDNKLSQKETVQPKKEGIVLKLADGTVQEIDSRSDGSVTDTQGNIVASKSSGKLIFDSRKASKETAIRYNEIYVPNGERFNLQLSDGTLVWMNSGSSLRFPQRFDPTSNIREVQLEGEAFFDVTTNVDKPFIVNTDKVNIEVLGTQFNLSAYSSDNAIATTLVEGAVQVYEATEPKNKIRLKPNDQALFQKNTQNLAKRKVNTDVYTAWMQNQLIIDDLTFPEILKKLERTHNVSFVNRASHLDQEIFQGEFRDEDIETILNTIALSTPFQYTVKQNKITITK